MRGWWVLTPVPSRQRPSEPRAMMEELEAGARPELQPRTSRLLLERCSLPAATVTPRSPRSRVDLLRAWSRPATATWYLPEPSWCCRAYRCADGAFRLHEMVGEARGSDERRRDEARAEQPSSRRRVLERASGEQSLASETIAAQEQFLGQHNVVVFLWESGVSCHGGYLLSSSPLR